MPSLDSNYHAELFSGKWRDDIKPLNVVQPEVKKFNQQCEMVLLSLEKSEREGPKVGKGRVKA